MSLAVANRVALGVIAVGVLLIVASMVAGGLFYGAVVAPVVELLGAPDERQFFVEPRNGGELLALFGFANVVAGICVFCASLATETLGRPASLALTRRMHPRRKLALGAAACGVIVFAAGELPALVIELAFLDPEFHAGGALAALGVVSQAGGLLLVCAAATLLLWGRLFRWADDVGWAKLRYSWVNRLAVAAVVCGVFGAMPLFPFSDAAGAFAVGGVVALTLGAAPHIFGVGRP